MFYGGKGASTETEDERKAENRVRSYGDKEECRLAFCGPHVRRTCRPEIGIPHEK